jgi:autotransporter-associated beta strand protein
VLATNNSQNWNGNFTFAGTNGLNLGTGAVTMNANRTITVNSGDLTVGGAISGSNFGLAKAGAGALVLAGSNTYNGTTLVTAGTLIIDGSTASGSAVTVASQGTLGGSGTINGATTVQGQLSPGNSPGLLRFGSSLTLTSTATVNMEINESTTRGGSFDAINIAGALVYAGRLNLIMGNTFSSGSYSFNLFDFGSQSGAFSDVSLLGSYSGNLIGSGDTRTLDDGTNSWTYTFSTGELGLVVVPEPSTWVLVASGLTTLATLRRRRH